MASSISPSHFYAKAAGVSHQNDDGSSRQSVIEKCRIGEGVALDHDESNQHDPYAVRLLRSDGKQIGFLQSDLARQVVQRSNTGTRYAAFISDLTGGSPAKPMRGVNLLIITAPPSVTDSEAQAYINEALSKDLNSNLRGTDEGGATSGCLASICILVALSVGTLLLCT